MQNVNAKIDINPLLCFVYGTCKTYPHGHTNGQTWYFCCGFYTICAKESIM